MLLDINKLHTNQRLMVSELLKLGAIVTSVDPAEELLKVEFNGKHEFLLDRFSSKAPFHMVKISGDKHLAKSILSAQGLTTPKGSVFTGNRVNEALDYAKFLFPVVLKPNWGSHGDYVVPDIRDRGALELAIWKFVALRGIDEPFIIEEFIAGEEYRVFITSQGSMAIVNRQSASIKGDGVQTIYDLVELENKKRSLQKSNKPTSLCPIVLDAEAHRFLEQHKIKLGFEHVLKSGETMPLRYQSNLAKGGLSVDVTGIAHPSVLEIAKKALASFPGLPVAGLDVITKDISAPLIESSYSIIEINSSPGLAMHAYPAAGNSQPVAKWMVDVMFPDFF